MKTPQDQAIQDLSQKYWRTKLQLENIISGDAPEVDRQLTVEQVELLQNFIEACEDTGVHHLAPRRID